MLDEALAAEHLILSSAGSHAQETWSGIITRKRADIKKTQHSVWVLNSNAARPEIVQAFCGDHGAQYVLFVTRLQNVKLSSTGSAIIDDTGTSRNQRARRYCESDHQKNWRKLNSSLGAVTGDIKRSTTGLWFDALEEVSAGTLDLSGFVKHSDGEILTRFWPSDSAYPVRRVVEVRSGKYRILAVGRLAPPFAVWLQV